MYQPLADKMRPNTIEDVVGQEHLTSEKGIVGLAIKKKKPLSLLFWGPPGSGKTTLANLFAKAFDGNFIKISGVSSGISDAKKIVQDIEKYPLTHQLTFLFIDEIHRWNKAQQDFLLPYLEKGTFFLIGATTENPSFSLNNALLSRVQVVTLGSLSKESLEKLITHYEDKYTPLNVSHDGRQYLTQLAKGDGRYLFNLIESLTTIEQDKTLDIEDIKKVLHKRAALFDKTGDAHYNLISALHKSIRGSDPDAAVYWLCRMLEGGQDPLYISRRLIRMATEDIGLADPKALTISLNALEAYKILGSPEGELALAECAIYLALAPKSNAVYCAYENAKDMAKETTEMSPPKKILNAPTKLMKNLGYGKDYQYDHDAEDQFSGQNYFPDGLPRQTFYEPKNIGYEREMANRVAYFQNLREKKSKTPNI